MNQIINFDNLSDLLGKNKRVKGSSFPFRKMSQQSEVEVKNLYQTTLDVLIKNNPNQLLFSLSEVSKQLRVGEEFVRRRIKSGEIRATYLGDKPLISITELARIIIEGV